MPRSMTDCIKHILWTVDKSPKTYDLFREKLIDLRIAIVNAELLHRERQHD
jgi:hypothetical protein